jgi:hypothetical protein
MIWIKLNKVITTRQRTVPGPILLTYIMTEIVRKNRKKKDEYN